MKNTLILEVADGKIISIRSTVKDLQLKVIDHDFEDSQVNTHETEFIEASQVKKTVKRIIKEHQDENHRLYNEFNR